MNKNYLLKLLKQFHEADGIKEYKEIDDEFLSWIIEYQKVLEELKEYYYSLGLEIDNWSSFELDKGVFDSIILDKEKTISMLQERQSELFVYNGIPFHISEQGIRQISGSDLFYTYNPFSEENVSKVRRLCQIGELIAISAAGKIYDKDIAKKISMINKQFEDLDTESSYDESRDNYFYTLFTPRKRKTKIKDLYK